MTRALILKTVREIFERGGDLTEVLEYLDGAIAELVTDERSDAYNDGLARIHEES